MAKITVLDKVKTQIAAIKAGKTLAKVNEDAGLSRGYIYECFDTNRVTLATVDSIAQALGCEPFDLLTRIEEATDTQPSAPIGVAEMMAT